MITINGEFNTAIVYAKVLEEGCEGLILQYLNHPLFADTKVRIMPDVHLGKESVIGFTATCNEYVVPAIVGVDIGCGINAYHLQDAHTSCDKLDKYIREHIPAGRRIHSEPHAMLEEAYEYVANSKINFDEFKGRVAAISEKLKMPYAYFMSALGTLGGGNHFIEIDEDENKNKWLLIHTGSRLFGLKVAVYHQRLAKRKTEKSSSIKFLTGIAADEYIDDMRTAQLYARLNRALIALQIGCKFLKISNQKLITIESIHNYVDFEYKIVRKGSISAQLGESLVIPFSMAEGAIIGIGKGNPDWNYSAPHGSGRKMSRTQAKTLSLEEYRKRMKNVWSSCVGKNTLDESPMAYKSEKDILSFVEDTLDVTHRIMPVYNFKAEE